MNGINVRCVCVWESKKKSGGEATTLMLNRWINVPHSHTSFWYLKFVRAVYLSVAAHFRLRIGSFSSLSLKYSFFLPFHHCFHSFDSVASCFYSMQLRAIAMSVKNNSFDCCRLWLVACCSMAISTSTFSFKHCADISWFDYGTAAICCRNDRTHTHTHMERTDMRVMRA